MKFLLLLLYICLRYSQNQNQPGDLYKKMGKDWPGVCGTGSNQSPINIIEGSNTNNTGKYNFI